MFGLRGEWFVDEDIVINIRTLEFVALIKPSNFALKIHRNVSLFRNNIMQDYIHEMNVKRLC